jgi:hydrogenase nickel incorporation protein HypA/HybF
MHEMSLAEGVRGIVEDAARAQGFSRVKAVVLEIGDLSSVQTDALCFCLEVVLRDTLAEGAEICVETVPGAGYCKQCARTVTIGQRYDACPECGSYQVQATSGMEMRVRELEVD